MYFFNIHLQSVSSLLRKYLRLLHLCGWLCLALCFTGQVASGGIEQFISPQPAFHWQSNGSLPGTPTHHITEYRAPELVFDFEDVLELDPEPDGQNGQAGKAAAAAARSRFLLSMAEESRAKATLAHCASALHQRIEIPLFILHHAWKHFPA